MINYIEKGIGLHDFLAKEGIQIEQLQSGEWVSTASDERTNSLIASYNPWTTEKEIKLKVLNSSFEEAVSLLTKNVTQSEKDSWETQVREAYGERPLSMLLAMARARGIPVETLVDKVKAKAEAYSLAYGTLQGRRDAIEDRIKAFPEEGECNKLFDLWSVSCTVEPL